MKLKKDGVIEKQISETEERRWPRDGVEIKKRVQEVETQEERERERNEVELEGDKRLKAKSFVWATKSFK